jgi:hypothetical protein
MMCTTVMRTVQAPRTEAYRARRSFLPRTHATVAATELAGTRPTATGRE